MAACVTMELILFRAHALQDTADTTVAQVILSTNLSKVLLLLFLDLCCPTVVMRHDIAYCSCLDLAMITVLFSLIFHQFLIVYYSSFDLASKR